VLTVASGPAQLLPGLLLIALLQATQPTLAQGLALLCTAEGLSWAPLGGGNGPVPDKGSACAHGWCTPRKPRAGSGIGAFR
jgi:hypothetical protein